MNQLATRPAPSAEVRRQEVRDMYRARFPREALAVELAVTRALEVLKEKEYA